jgi:glycosyltransferase involved in cell wall biosynthesis
MAAAVPIVATKIGGVPDVISAAEGYLVPPEDPDALAAAICAAYSDRVGAEERASRARRRLAADFGVGPWLSRYEEIYRRIQRSHQEMCK